MRRIAQRGRRVTVGVAVAALATILGATPAAASQVRPVNLEQMTERAVLIFAGRCLETGVVHDAALGREVTVATFEVERAVKGDPGKTVTVRMAVFDDVSGTPGRPQFETGAEVVLFLYGESRLGLTSPVGLGQGRFDVVTDKAGRRLALNALANRNLLRDLTPEGKARLGTAFENFNDRSNLEADALLDLAAALVEPRP